MKLKRNIEQDIIQMAMLIKEKQRYLEDLNTQIHSLREEIRGLMKEHEIKHIQDDNLEIKITFPKSFDVGLLGVSYPELYEKYTSIEKKIMENVVLNKKDLKRFYPKEYSACEVELTPRLTIK